jgi:hypothetical protein
VFSAVLTGVLLLSLLVPRAPRGRRLRELGSLLLTGLPAALVLVASAVMSEDQSALMFTRPGFAWLPWRTLLTTLPQVIAPGPMGRSIAVLLGVAVAIAFASRCTLRGEGGAERGLRVAALLMLLAGVVAPLNVPGWAFFSQRFLTLGVLLVFVTLPVERLQGVGVKVLPVALFAASAGWLLSSVPFHRALANTVSDAMAGLDARVKRSRDQLPIPLAFTEGQHGLGAAADVPMLNPLLHLGALYAVTFGGTVPSVFTVNPAVHPLIRRHRANERAWVSSPARYWGAVATSRFARDREYREGIEGELATMGVYYEGVVLLGARPDDIAFWSKRGYAVDAERGSAVVAHFQPCTISVSLPEPPPPAFATFDVIVGAVQVVSGAHPPMTTDATGLVRYDIAPAPCGDVVVKGRWDLADAPRAATLICRNGDDEGALHVAVSHDSGAVRCDGLAVVGAH